ncbi:hypothetical protein TRFO_13650 [Tritrichomonas foetus]|uniref:Uncharacterized protein n=1 Tax=Tritrichomonas foetus TaxID=1144522 RepID=A0A1J4KXI3_9EUKA|nr:hypothetical protein TRFO_13650 [Tritrichomonas foetus]|eukprot:OHT15961.1 hypothetical protein TRFO_13650 [Tritrichomonas foetus]
MLHHKRRKNPISLRKHLIFIVVSAFVLISTYFYLYKTDLNQRIIYRTNYNYINETDLKTKKKPLCHIYIYSSGPEICRVQYSKGTWANHPLVHDGTFRITNIMSSEANIAKEVFRTIRVPCTDLCPEIDGLVCRQDYSYIAFLHEAAEADWLYRAIDDQYLDLYNLYEYITNLNKIVDPAENLVSKSRINSKHMPDRFILGGIGWLLSKGMVKYMFRNKLNLMTHFKNSFITQDDTTMSLVNDLVFPNPLYWDEPHFIGQNFQPMFDKYFKDYDFSGVPECPSNFMVALLKNIIGIHLFGRDERLRTFSERLKELPEDLCFYYLPKDPDLYLCMRNNATIVARNDLDAIRANTPVYTMEHKHKPPPKKRPRYYSDLI